MMNLNKISKTVVGACLFILISACGENARKSKAVYLLLDTSGTYTQELVKAQAIMNYLLATLNSGDSIAIARIDSGSFSEKDIVAKTTFDIRPSRANDQKRLFKSNVDHFVSSLKRGSSNTDITGGLVQAADYVNETKASEKYVLIFSDLEEDLAKGHVRDFPIDVKGIQVVALNVTKLRSDNIDPRDYKKRLAEWQLRVEQGGGQWRVVNDLERLEKLISRH
ncbi:VWA domain-containing protein [Aliikangiella sp. IMCC44653]